VLKHLKIYKAKNRLKAIIDCNSFYAACERVFEPSLHGRPVVVLSNNDGCIVSRTDEAKALGIQMAGPYYEAKEILKQHKVAVFSSNYHLYGDMSWRVMETLRRLCQHVEVYSVDEAFVDLGGMTVEELAFAHAAEASIGRCRSTAGSPAASRRSAARWKASVDSAPSLSLVVSSPSPSLQPPVAKSYNGRWRRFRPRNH